MTIAKWILSLAVGGFLLAFGATKFTGGAHIFPLIELKASTAGLPFADLFFPWVNYATGALEIIAGLFVILPMTRKSFGALLAVVPFLGAFAFHISPFLGVITPDGYAENADGLQAALEAGTGFEPSHFSDASSPTLFLLATGFLVLALANAYLSRKDS